MGSLIELNDTLAITKSQGFPEVLDLDLHREKPFNARDFEGKVFSFHKHDERLYHRAPTRVFLVEVVDGKWIYWGHALVLEQTIHTDGHSTSGKFKIQKVYDPEYQKFATKNESPAGKSYFD